jgi:hypothetical protein
MLANQTAFGLSSAVWTTDADEQDWFVRHIDAGAVFLNDMSASHAELPFGGVKNSGYGRELTFAGIREFCNLKAVWRAWYVFRRDLSGSPPPTFVLMVQLRILGPLRGRGWRSAQLAVVVHRADGERRRRDAGRAHLVVGAFVAGRNHEQSAGLRGDGARAHGAGRSWAPTPARRTGPGRLRSHFGLTNSALAAREFTASIGPTQQAALQGLPRPGGSPPATSEPSREQPADLLDRAGQRGGPRGEELGRLVLGVPHGRHHLTGHVRVVMVHGRRSDVHRDHAAGAHTLAESHTVVGKVVLVP